MARFNYVGGRKPVKLVSGATPGTYTANTRFAIAHGLTNSAGRATTPDFFWADEAAPDPREKQTLTITGTPTGGTFTISFGGQTTAAIAYNAAASAVQTALVALTSIGAGNVIVTGGTLPGTAVVLDFSAGALAGTFPALVTTTSSLTGGTTPAIAVTGAAFTHHNVKVIGADHTNVYLIASGDVAKIWVATA